MFRVGDLVVPSDGWLGRAIIDIYKIEDKKVQFPARIVEFSGRAMGIRVEGDTARRNCDCFKLCDDGPW